MPSTIIRVLGFRFLLLQRKKDKNKKEEDKKKKEERKQTNRTGKRKLLKEQRNGLSVVLQILVKLSILRGYDTLFP